ncbi:hypothetical protein [Streptomyces sp. NPDC003952]
MHQGLPLLHGHLAQQPGGRPWAPPGRPPPARSAPRTLFEVVHKPPRPDGVLVRNHTNLREELEDHPAPRPRSGRTGGDTTVVQGFDHTVDAFRGMLREDDPGKMPVRVDG